MERGTKLDSGYWLKELGWWQGHIDGWISTGYKTEHEICWLTNKTCS